MTVTLNVRPVPKALYAILLAGGLTIDALILVIWMASYAQTRILINDTGAATCMIIATVLATGCAVAGYLGLINQRQR